MNILFVTYHTCARADKEARALEAAGHQVIILQHVAASEEILYATELSSFYRNEIDLAKRIIYFAEWAEVIHVHNEPNWIVRAAAMARDRACPDTPLVFDAHDLESQRESGEVDQDETPAIHAADAIIVPSRAYKEGVERIYNLPGTPVEVIYSFCSKRDFIDDPLPRVNGVVYEGATVCELKNFTRQTPGYKHYRDYVSLTKQFTFYEIPFHLYGVRSEFKLPYLAAGAVVHDVYSYPVMMRQLSRYDWGLCGHIEDHPQWQKAMPNKLFEYLAAGIPVLSINAKEVGELIEEYEIGMVAENMNELAAMARNKQYRAAKVDNVHKHRGKFTMECQTDKIEALYGQAADNRRRRLETKLQMPTCNSGRKADGSWVCFGKPQAVAKNNRGSD